jgi:hypothetical protein
MTDHFTNMDAIWLNELVDALGQEGTILASLKFMEFEGEEGAWFTSETEARLRTIARNLQSLDDRVVALQSRTYEDGWAAAMATIYARSNVLPNPEGEDATGKAIMSQIDRLAAEGRVKRYALGERALDDQPHRFNAPVRRAAKPPKASMPDIDLDLDFLKEI